MCSLAVLLSSSFPRVFSDKCDGPHASQHREARTPYYADLRGNSAAPRGKHCWLPASPGMRGKRPRHHGGGLPLGSSLRTGGLLMVCRPVRPHDPGRRGGDWRCRPCPTGPAIDRDTRNAGTQVYFSPRPPRQARRSCGNVAGVAGRAPICVGGAGRRSFHQRREDPRDEWASYVSNSGNLSVSLTSQRGNR
ncbi:hypothetical protein Tc00.1047053508939.40 [Trypanosoma cruzi]|uniref:Uncharacterized protein n=1 Tax=Trypanosoma cruzi (strain CL Brener) TaxID=353153 RepID=Q4D1X3_TRYCC|nr:hypothetical protein Tc00.1047053508939.40 [Trypanosoma cruzi]EAN86524.1 hypothetical protein Tc00.1047053508939.40 [Trypanosoma cruzi]|eukprot:XP_808375.1 hypothetical protein [Trypanosoma cruzi strain CL Brener]